MKNILLLFALMGFASCAVGPLMVHESARTVGESHHEFVVGYGVAGYLAKWNAGLSQNLDFGVQLESLSLGLRLKYALLNNQEKGYSLALVGGTGVSMGGKHDYGDVMFSYLSNSWEPYTMARFVHVTNSEKTVSDANTNQSLFVIPKETFDYQQYFFGCRYWADKNWSVNVELSRMEVKGWGSVSRPPTFLSAGLAYKF